MKYRRMITATLIVALVFAFATANATVMQWGEGDLYSQLRAVFGLTSDGHSHDGVNSRALGTTTSNPIFATNVTAVGFKAGVTTNVSTESTLTSAALSYGVISMVSGIAKTIGIDDGVPGQMVTIVSTTKEEENVTISKTAFPVTTHSFGWSTIVFDTQGDWLTMLWLDNVTGWVVIQNSGCTIS
jgi:hypothetical protein